MQFNQNYSIELKLGQFTDAIDRRAQPSGRTTAATTGSDGAQ
jgi:hypothetical protein